MAQPAEFCPDEGRRIGWRAELQITLRLNSDSSSIDWHRKGNARGATETFQAQSRLEAAQKNADAAHAQTILHIGQALARAGGIDSPHRQAAAYNNLGKPQRVLAPLVVGEGSAIRPFVS